MNTDGLVVYEKDEYKDPIFSLSAMLVQNPEIPDMMRDAAPYFSKNIRQKIIKMASVGEFIIKMSEGRSDFSANGEDDHNSDMKDFYATMKKYIPMNKRNSIDVFINMIENISTKLKQKPASNGLENVINSLSRINELNKIMASAGNIKRLTGTLKAVQEGNTDMSGIMDAIGMILGKEKMQKLDNMLSTLAQ